MTRKDTYCVIAVLLAGVFVHGADLCSGNLGLIAEGVSCVGAQRVLDGQVPYRDFWTIYAPGGYYLLAGLFAVFGSQLLTARVAAMTLTVLAGGCVYGLFRTRHPPVTALAWTLGVVLALFSMGHYFATYPPVLLCMTAALAATAAYFNHRRPRWLLAAGVAVSLAVVFKHDVGGYIALSIVIALCANRLIGPPLAPPRPLGRELLVFAIGCATMAIPVYVAMWLAAGADMWRDLVVFPLTDFSASRPEHFPGIWPNVDRMTSVGRAIEEVSHRVRFLIPRVVMLASVVQLVLMRKRISASRFGVQVMLTVAMAFFWTAAHVQINTHIYSMTILCAVLGALWLTDIRKVKHGALARGVPVVMVMVMVLGFLPRPAFDVARMYVGQHDLMPVGLDRARHIRVDRGIAQSVHDAVTYVQVRTRPDQPVYVGVLRHDVIIAGPVLLYFLMDRPIPVRYHELHPAVADTPAVQREMIADLRRANVVYTVLWRRFDDQALDRFHARRKNKLPDTGATLLDEFIHANYRKIESFGRFEVYRRVAHAPAG